jgi:hypothetical protein
MVLNIHALLFVSSLSKYGENETAVDPYLIHGPHVKTTLHQGNFCSDALSSLLTLCSAEKKKRKQTIM